jgi:hypothetical protein
MGVGKVVTMLYPDYIYLTATGGQTPIYAERALVSAMSERHVRSVAQKIRDALHPDASLPRARASMACFGIPFCSSARPRKILAIEKPGSNSRAFRKRSIA